MNQGFIVAINPNPDKENRGDVMGRFELHCHSHHSKGRKIAAEGLDSPREIIRHARALGLGGIAITDHDTNAAWAEAAAEAKKQGIIFIPAMEISSASGHIIGLGLSERVRKGMGAAETMEAIRGQGGVCIAAHPFDAKGDGIMSLMASADAAEVFNALAVDRFGNMAAERRARKNGLPMVAGSDAHTLDMIGTACNHMDADSVDGVIHAVRRGSVVFEKKYVPVGVIADWVRWRLTSSYLQVNAYIDSHYRGPKRWLAKRMLNDYVLNGRRSWERMAGLGLVAAAAYSALRLAVYY